MSTLSPIPCACISARRMARLLTKMYAEEMGQHMEPAQFGLLQMVANLPHCTQAALARALAMDKTTVSRDVAVMKKRGWLEGGRGEIRVTEDGRAMLTQTAPHWLRAQKRLHKLLGENGWEALFAAMRGVEQAFSAEV